MGRPLDNRNSFGSNGLRHIEVWHGKLFLDFLDFSLDSVDEYGIIQAHKQEQRKRERKWSWLKMF